MSPVSENALVMKLASSPFFNYFRQGLCVALATDTPRVLHLTSEPLLEEFAIASQFWRLRPTDLAEICRNSVLISGFPDAIKEQWLGERFYLPGTHGNHPHHSAIPALRAAFRAEALADERNFVLSTASTQEEPNTIFPMWSM